MFDIFKYLLQGMAHLVVLFLNFIDYNSGIIYCIIIIFLLLMLPKMYKEILNVIKCCFSLFRFSIVNLFFIITLLMNMLIVLSFDDELSFLFILLFLGGLISDLKGYLTDTSKEISFKIICKETGEVMKSTLILMLIRIINMIDCWDFSKINNLYIYLIYGCLVLVCIVGKKLFIILSDLNGKAKCFGCVCSFFEIIALYIYSSIKHKSLTKSEQHLMKYFLKIKNNKCRKSTSKKIFRLYFTISLYKSYIKKEGLNENN